MTDGNGFDQHRYEIEHRLSALEESSATKWAEIREMDRRLIKLETKVGLYAAAAGLLAGVAFKIAELVLKVH